MSAIEPPLNQIAAIGDQQLYDDGKEPTLELINARLLHNTARMKCYAALLAAGSADIDSPAQEILRQAEKEVDDTELTLANLEVIRDRHIARARLRAGTR